MCAFASHPSSSISVLRRRCVLRILLGGGVQGNGRRGSDFLFFKGVLYGTVRGWLGRLEMRLRAPESALLAICSCSCWFLDIPSGEENHAACYLGYLPGSSQL
jgi:hypothetical protein